MVVNFIEFTPVLICCTSECLLSDCLYEWIDKIRKLHADPLSSKIMLTINETRGFSQPASSKQARLGKKFASFFAHIFAKDLKGSQKIHVRASRGFEPTRDFSGPFTSFRQW